MRHRYIVFSLFLPVPLLSILVRDAGGLAGWMAGALHALGAVVLLIGVPLLARAARRIVPRPRVLRLPFLVLNLPAVLAAVACAEGLRILAGGTPSTGAELLDRVLVAVALVEVGMSVAGNTFLPRALADLRRHDPTAHPSFAEPPGSPGTPRPRSPGSPALSAAVVIGGCRIALADLSHILSDGSGVTIHGGPLPRRVAVPFDAAMADMPPAAGRQVGPGIWVSTARLADAVIVRERGAHLLRLADGTHLPVAATLRDELDSRRRALPGPE